MFQFKQFTINQEKTALKVGTDSVLLGSLTDFSNSKTILDIGTGTGILALMAAQKSDATIDAIEIEENAFEQSKDNFSQSKWDNRIETFHTSIQNFTKETDNLYDQIISNPPYFNSSTKSSCESANIARHTDSLNYEDLCQSVSTLLSKNGSFSLILPFESMKQFKWIAFDYGLYCSKEILIQPKPSKNVNLVIMFFKKRLCFPQENRLTIRDNNNNYTAKFKEITSDFYL